MVDCMPRKQQEFIEQIEKDCLESTNMTSEEAYNFAFRCWQMGYEKAKNQTSKIEWIKFETDEEGILIGELPEVDQEILVSQNDGMVFLDTFIRDGEECYLDSCKTLIEEAVAWMPLPNPYNG